MRTRVVLSIVAFSVALFGCGGGYTEGLTQIRLPAELKEISGLALGKDGVIYAIADEVGVVYAIDHRSGRIAPFTAFGQPPVKGDFEGLATTGDKIVAITSDGRLYQKLLMADADQYQKINTKLGKQCEIEGLEVLADGDTALIACKTAKKKRHRDNLALLAWSLSREERNESSELHVPLETMALSKLNPSAVALTSGGQSLIVIAARQKVLVELSLDGEVVRTRNLPDADLHPQAEGVVALDSAVFVANEGSSGPATLSHYKDGI